MRLLMILFCFCYCLLIQAEDLSNIKTTPKPNTVTLTFDDGPNPVFTPQILKILKKYDVKATFFVMGVLAKKYPSIIKQIQADGHAVAVHSMTHPMLTRVSDKKLAYEVNQPKKIIKNIIGIEPVCFRPPYGVANERVKKYIRSQGMAVIPIGFNSYDYNRPGVNKIAAAVIKNAHSKSIILLHDGYHARSQTVKALPIIIQGIRAKGLDFSAICYPK